MPSWLGVALKRSLFLPAASIALNEAKADTPGCDAAMTSKRRNHVTDLRGVSRMAIDATTGLTDLVEAMHHQHRASPAGLGGPVGRAPERHHRAGLQEHPRRDARGGRRPRCGAGAAGAAARRDGVIARSARPCWRRSTACWATTSPQTGNPLAIAMQLRRDGQPLELDAGRRSPRAIPRRRQAAGAGARPVHERPAVEARRATTTAPRWRAIWLHARLPALQQRPAHLHQRARIRRDARGAGRRLAGAARGTGHRRPQHGRPGGAQRACTTARRRATPGRAGCGSSSSSARRTTARRWSAAATGSTLLLAQTPYTAPFARLGKIRSAGITDLRHGSLLDEDWHGRDRFARGEDPRRRRCRCPQGVRCYAIAATTGKQAGDLGASLLGDGLVPLASALGRHDNRASRSRFRSAPVDRLRHGPPRPAQPARSVRADP